MADIINMVPRTVKQPVKSKLILGLPKTEDTKFSLPVTKGLFFIYSGYLQMILKHLFCRKRR